MEFKKIAIQIAKILLPVALSVVSVFAIFYFRSSITQFSAEHGFEEVSTFVEEPISKIEDERVARKRAGFEQCISGFNIESVSIEKRGTHELSQYALCRAHVLKSRNECAILPEQNKNVCENDVNDFVFATSLIKLFSSSFKEGDVCAESTIAECNRFVRDLSSKDYIISDLAMNTFCINACSALKERDALAAASAIHTAFSRKTPTNTQSESEEKTKRDFSAIIDLDPSKCDPSVGEGIDCKNEIYYLSAWSSQNKYFCEKMVDVGGVMNDVFKGICLAQFEENEVGYCQRYLDHFKYNFCMEENYSN